MTLLLQAAGEPADGSAFWRCTRGLIPFWPEFFCPGRSRGQSKWKNLMGTGADITKKKIPSAFALGWEDLDVE